MTNEEKATEIARECVYCFADAENGALKMAEWKDEQFKDYLMRKKEYYRKKAESTVGTDSLLFAAKMDAIDMILIDIPSICTF